MKQSERPGLHRWSRREYGQLIDHGLLDEDDPIELLDGLLLVKEPQHSPRRTAVILVAKALERGFGEGWLVQTQSEPARPGPARRNWGYAVIESLGADATVPPLAAPASAISVADLLP